MMIFTYVIESQLVVLSPQSARLEPSIVLKVVFSRGFSYIPLFSDISWIEITFCEFILRLFVDAKLSASLLSAMLA